jgi:hypothetical protein
MWTGLTTLPFSMPLRPPVSLSSRADLNLPPSSRKPTELITSELAYDSSPPRNSDITIQVNRQFLEQDFHLQDMQL